MNGIDPNITSPYRRGADSGALMGVCLTALFFTMAYSLSVPGLGLVALVLMVSVPVVTYVMLRRSYVADRGTTIFSSLWMEGIVMFFCGGLIASVAAVVWMRWIQPDFINRQVQVMIDLYNSTEWERGREMAEILRLASERHMLPSAIELTVDMLWLIVFSGSMLSMLMALLVRARDVKGGR